jgi:hypothetical protein
LLGVEIGAALMAMGCMLAYGGFAVQFGVPGGLKDEQYRNAMVFATLGMVIDLVGGAVLIRVVGRAARRHDVRCAARRLGPLLGVEGVLVIWLWIVGTHGSGVVGTFILVMLGARLAHHVIAANIARDCLRHLEPLGAPWVATGARVGAPALALAVVMLIPARGWSGRPPLIHIGDLLIAMTPVAVAAAPFVTLSIAARRMGAKEP